jgi:hypothetical protein
MGLSELSSLPLAFVDFFKQFPKVRAKYPGFNEFVRVLFAASFLPIRGLYWPYASYTFWVHALKALDEGSTAPTFVIYTFMVCNIIMTLLQWFWASLVIKGILAKMRNDPKAKEM